MFKKGYDKNRNYGGRPKGVQNKVSNAVKSDIANFLSSKFEQLEEVYKELSPYEKARFLVALVPYVVPKLNHNELEIENSGMGADLSKLNETDLCKLQEISEKLSY